MQNHPSPTRINLETQQAHRKQFFWQILLPVVAGSVILLAAGGIAAATPNDKPAVWAHISIIFMAVVVGFAAIFQLGGIILLLLGTRWVQEKLPGGSYLVQAYLRLFSSEIKSVDDKLSSPWIQIRSNWAGIRKIFKQ